MKTPPPGSHHPGHMRMSFFSVLHCLPLLCMHYIHYVNTQVQEKNSTLCKKKHSQHQQHCRWSCYHHCHCHFHWHHVCTPHLYCFLHQLLHLHFLAEEALHQKDHFPILSLHMHHQNNFLCRPNQPESLHLSLLAESNNNTLALPSLREVPLFIRPTFAHSSTFRQGKSL